MSAMERPDAENSVDLDVKPSSKSKKLTPVSIFCICLSVIVVVLLGVVIYLLLNPKTTTIDDTPPPREVLITPENVEERIAELQEVNPDSAYTASMNVDWYFDDGSSPSNNAYVENYVSNTRVMYFEVFLSDTNEQVYSSPYIPVGTILEDLTLTKDLAMGDYPAVLIYHLVDDDNKEISTLSVTVNLHILN